MCSVCPETSAGAKERAGFKDAPEMCPMKIPANTITIDIQNETVIIFVFLLVATNNITNIKINVKTTSNRNDKSNSPFGNVAPNFSSKGNRNDKNKIAVKAPINCEIIYGKISLGGNIPATARPIETAGLKCAPEILPNKKIIKNKVIPNVKTIPIGGITPD